MADKEASAAAVASYQSLLDQAAANPESDLDDVFTKCKAMLKDQGIDTKGLKKPKRPKPPVDDPAEDEEGIDASGEPRDE